MRKYIVYISLLIIHISCNTSKYENVETVEWSDFKIVKNITAKELNFENSLRPTDILVKDSILITIELQSDKIFQVYNLNSMERINECINIGQGPNDMLIPQFMEMRGDELNVLDLATYSVYTFDFNDFIINPVTEPIRKIKLEAPIFVTAQFLGNNIVGKSFNPEYQLTLFGIKGEKIKDFATYPSSSMNYTDAERIEASYMKLVTNDLGKIAIFYYMTDLLEIYGSDQQLLKRVHGPDHFYSEFKEKEHGIASPKRDVSRDAFVCPRNAGNNLFVLYNGKFIHDPDHTSACSKLLSFSWEGVPDVFYNLNDPLISFDIDQKNKKIFGISDTPDFHIVEYSYGD